MGAEELEAALNKATRMQGSGTREMRFGPRAKHAVFFAALDEARNLGHDHVGGEHILLGLLEEEPGLAAHVLLSSGITREQVRRIVAAGDESPASLDHNSEAQNAVELAQIEARALGHEQVETAHVLLALLGPGDGVAVGVVRGLGAEPRRLREGLLAEIDAGHGDYEGFSTAARELVARAEDEARELDHGHVGTEHLLLVLLRDDGSVAAQVLDSLEITLDRAHEAMIARIAAESEAPPGPIALTQHMQRALALAAAEARSTGGYVQPEHLLLGLAREAEGFGAQVLLELAGNPDVLRTEVIRRLPGRARGRGSGFFGRFTSGAGQVVVLAQEEARLLAHDQIDSGHILLALARGQENAAGRALAALGISHEQVREALLGITGGAKLPSPGLLPFAASATQVFELALRDARWLEHERIGTEHIVLGVLRESEGVSEHVLDALGAGREELRAEALSALAAPWASGLSPAEEELSRTEQWLREAQANYRDAMTDEAREHRAAEVEISQRIVDRARGNLLSPSCQDALRLLAEFATEEWLKGQPPPEDADHRGWYRDHCAVNIHAQLLHALFHPALGPEANPIQGHPGGPDAPDPRAGNVPFSLGG